MKKPIISALFRKTLLLLVILLIAMAVTLDQGVLYHVELRKLTIFDRKIPYREKILEQLPARTKAVYLNSDSRRLEDTTRILDREKDIQTLRLFTYSCSGQLQANHSTGLKKGSR